MGIFEKSIFERAIAQALRGPEGLPEAFRIPKPDMSLEEFFKKRPQEVLCIEDPPEYTISGLLTLPNYHSIIPLYTENLYAWLIRQPAEALAYVPWLEVSPTRRAMVSEGSDWLRIDMHVYTGPHVRLAGYMTLHAGQVPGDSLSYSPASTAWSLHEILATQATFAAACAEEGMHRLLAVRYGHDTVEDVRRKATSTRMVPCDTAWFASDAIEAAAAWITEPHAEASCVEGGAASLAHIHCTNILACDGLKVFPMSRSSTRARVDHDISLLARRRAQWALWIGPMPWLGIYRSPLGCGEQYWTIMPAQPDDARPMHQIDQRLSSEHLGAAIWETWLAMFPNTYASGHQRAEQFRRIQQHTQAIVASS